MNKQEKKRQQKAKSSQMKREDSDYRAKVQKAKRDKYHANIDESRYYERAKK